jgi:hypothetical protein
VSAPAIPTKNVRVVSAIRAEPGASGAVSEPVCGAVRTRGADTSSTRGEAVALTVCVLSSFSSVPLLRLRHARSARCHPVHQPRPA